MRFYSVGELSNRGRRRNKIWHKGSLGDEADARTIAQRKCAIPHSHNRNIIDINIDKIWCKMDEDNA